MQTSRTRTGVHDHVPYLSRVRSSATQSAFLHHDWQGRTPSRGRPRNKNERGSWLMNHERNGLPPFSLPLRPASSCVFARFAKPERLRTYSALSTERAHAPPPWPGSKPAESACPICVPVQAARLL